MKFVRKGFQSTECLEQLEDDFCFAPITEISDWPPTLSSSVDFSFINRAGKYVYPMRFIYDYRYILVECPNGTFINDAVTAPVSSSGKKDLYFITFVKFSINILD